MMLTFIYLVQYLDNYGQIALKFGTDFCGQNESLYQLEALLWTNYSLSKPLVRL